MTATPTPPSLPTPSLQQLANYLTTGFWTELGTVPRSYNLGSSGFNPNGGVLHYNVSGWSGDSNGLTTDRQALAREAFKLYEAALGIRFIETSSTGTEVDFFFSDNDPGRAYAYTGGMSYSQGVDYTVINIASDWHGGLSTFGSYTPQTFLHEIGHGLGLGHQGLYNYTGSTLTYATSAQFSNDSWQESMMSYWSQTQNPNTGADFAWLQTPMAVDWLALDAIYGPQGFGVNRAFQGDTTYGFNTTISASTSTLWNQFSQQAHQTAYTLVDGGGYDTLDLSGFSQTQMIDLRPSDPNASAPSISSIAGLRGNLTIAAGTIIEAAIGGSGNDTLIGNTANNALNGGAGNDIFYDSPGSDFYTGGAGTDSIYFSESIELLSITPLESGLAIKRIANPSEADQISNDIEIINFNSLSYSFASLFEGSSQGGSSPSTATQTPTRGRRRTAIAQSPAFAARINSFGNPDTTLGGLTNADTRNFRAGSRDPLIQGGLSGSISQSVGSTSLLTKASGFSAFVQEEQSLDAETTHAPEQLGFLAFGGSSGSLLGTRLDGAGAINPLLAAQPDPTILV